VSESTEQKCLRFEGALKEINRLVCYASEADTSSKDEALLEVGNLVRGALYGAPTGFLRSTDKV
jgi:hypothetical protein